MPNQNADFAQESCRIFQPIDPGVYRPIGFQTNALGNYTAVMQFAHQLLTSPAQRSQPGKPAQTESVLRFPRQVRNLNENFNLEFGLGILPIGLEAPRPQWRHKLLAPVYPMVQAHTVKRTLANRRGTALQIQNSQINCSRLTLPLAQIRSQYSLYIFFEYIILNWSMTVTAVAQQPVQLEHWCASLVY